MLSPIQQNTSAHRPTKAARGPVPVRFTGQNIAGSAQQDNNRVSIDTYESSTKGFDKEKLDAYSKAIVGLHDFGPNPDDPYNNYDFAARYQELTRRARAHYDKFSKSLAPKELESMKEHHELGLVEEAGDMLFEAYTIRALRKDVFTDKTVARWSKNALPAATQQARNQKPFENFLTQVDQDLPHKKAEKVEKQMGWEPAKAHQMLQLMAAKFTLMRSKNINYDIWDDNKNLLKAEAEELREAFPWYSPRQAQIWLLAIAGSSSLMPLGFFGSQLEGIVSSKLKTPIKREDMLENVFAKQGRRQEFDYQNPHHTENKRRKEILKGFEVLNEAAILQNARNNHPTSIPTF